ncbi:MAG: hypothetical protein ACPW61_08270 [Methyloligella sp. ZOD6]
MTMNRSPAKVIVEVIKKAIVVSLPGTHLKIVYQLSPEFSGLVAQTGNVRDDPKSPMAPVQFGIAAWQAANEKARELGWII